MSDNFFVCYQEKYLAFWPTTKAKTQPKMIAQRRLASSAQQARAAAPSRLIPSIKYSSGAILTDPTTTNKTCAKFYGLIYSTSDCSQATTDNILDKTEFPRIDSNYMEDLCRPISANKIEGTIKPCKMENHLALTDLP